MRLADRNALLRRLEDCQIDQGLARDWVSYARSNIRLISTGMLDVDTTDRGASKFGGEPDLPVGWAWPTRPAYSYRRIKGDYRPDSAWRQRPLQFLAQINLQDIEQAGCDLKLPSSGLLLFFYDTEVQPWGFDPCDAPGWQVHYVADAASTQRQSSPTGGASKVKPMKLEASEGLPGWEWLEEIMPDDSRPSHAALRDELVKLPEDEGRDLLFYSGSAFAGWPSPIQSSMELECEMVSNGVYAGDSRGYADPRMPEFRKRALEWRLLLQIKYDEELDWMWGDAGMLYFLCREDDIAFGRFDRVWMVLQCG